jgi:hypothetical protein
VFCACEIIQLFSVVFCVVTSVHKFDFRIVMNEKPTNGNKRKQAHAVVEICFLRDLYVFSPLPSSRVLRESTHTVQVKCILLSNGQ